MAQDGDGQAGRRRLIFGPGTVMGIVGAVIVLVVGYFTDQVRKPATHGSTEPGGAPGGLTMTAGAPEWQPEPALILHRAGELRLTPDQRRRVEGLNATWLERKAALRARPNGPDPDADQLAEDERERSWTAALGLLEPNQRERLLRLVAPRARPAQPAPAVQDR
jgi:hypothetical protein